jgi:protease-4
VFGCVAAGLALASGSGCVSIHFREGSRRPLVESVVDGETGPKILLLDIEGTINEAPKRTSLGLLRDESTVSRVREQLDRAREDSAVRALLLRINSPGGTATASDIAYREILDFKRERDVPSRPRAATTSRWPRIA